VLATTTLAALAATALSATSGPGALILGGGLALSSTAVAMQVLADRGETGSRHGRATFSVLLFQVRTRGTGTVRFADRQTHCRSCRAPARLRLACCGMQTDRRSPLHQGACERFAEPPHCWSRLRCAFQSVGGSWVGVAVHRQADT
jgi:hypothetical protein